jgi:HK97 family phage major capsid protein/HK97 family phage prohead protease
VNRAAPAATHCFDSLWHVKSVDTDRRVISGMATTPEPDRRGDIIEPLGVSFTNPLPLLLFHDTTRPVGSVTFKKPTKDGIAFEATIAAIEESGTLRERVNEAWQSVKAGLISGVSIGFRALESAFMKDGGIHFLKTEVVELSLVTIPANANASILTVKSLDSRRKDAPAMTTAEQMTQWSNTRAPIVARMNDLMADSAKTGATLDEADAKEYDDLAARTKSIDAQLERLRLLEQSQIAAATPITPATGTPGNGGHGSSNVVQVKSVLPPGTGFIRYVQAMALSRGVPLQALEYAKRWKDSTPEVELVLKAAVAAGTTTDATWAGPLVVLQNLTGEFLNLLRPATVLGKVSDFRKVPFNVSVPSQTGGGTYQWVGQGAPKPVGKLAFSTVTLGITKCAGIIAITEELARSSTPDAEATIRQDMINGIAAFLDLEFTDPTKAAVANVSPGSVTNGVTPLTTAGTTPANAMTDLQALIKAINAAGLSTATVVVLMSEANAMALGFALHAGSGAPLFPGLGVAGGTALGVKVITSNALGNNVIALEPTSILYADDGGVTIDASREASVQMDSAPDNPALATTVFTSFWQSNLIGLRAERFINWKKARTGCVQYLVGTYTA